MDQEHGFQSDPVLIMFEDLPADAGALYTSMFAYAPLATAVVEGETHVVDYANPALCERIGIPIDALIGRPLSDVLVDGSARHLRRLLDRVYRTGKAAHMGEVDTYGVVVGITVWPITVDARPGRMVVQLSGSNSAEGEHPGGELRNANQRLLLAGLEAQEHADVAQHDLAMQRELDRRLGNFLLNVAHDLKTPLTTMKGSAQLLARRLARGETMDTDLARRTLTQIDRSIQSMVEQIDELLERHGRSLDDALDRDVFGCNLSEVVARVVSQFEHGRQGWRFSRQAQGEDALGPWSTPDMERVLWNLLSNAVTYSPDGGEIDVRLRRDKGGATGGQVVLSVRDQGIGIPVAELPSIFERYFRAGNTGEIAGSGIGLAGVKEVVDKYGGTVWAEPNSDRGTTFTVQLPLRTADQ